MKKLYLFLAIIFSAATAHAQSGCIDSPENPTALLALVGAAGAGITILRDRFRRK